MTDIEKMAREAGAEPEWCPSLGLDQWHMPDGALLRFAQAVAIRCAELAEWRSSLQQDRAKAEGNDYAAERAIEASACAAAIRAEFEIRE